MSTVLRKLHRVGRAEGSLRIDQDIRTVLFGPGSEAVLSSPTS